LKNYNHAEFGRNGRKEEKKLLIPEHSRKRSKSNDAFKEWGSISHKLVRRGGPMEGVIPRRSGKLRLIRDRVTGIKQRKVFHHGRAFASEEREKAP